jgi:hypothetical protein
MIVTGGTDRFDGAIGNLMTNAFVQDGTDEWRTDLSLSPILLRYLRLSKILILALFKS